MHKKIVCPICIVTEGEYHFMIYKSDGYFKCPICKTETWPNPNEPASDELMQFMQDMSKTHYATDALPAGEAIKGKSGSSSKKHKLQPQDRPTQQKLYNQLFKQT